MADALQEFVPRQRPVVQGGGQAEPVFDERALAGGVALEHGPDLGDRHVGLVDDQEEVLGEVVE